MLLLHDEQTQAIRVVTGNDLDLCNLKDKLCFVTQNRAAVAQGACARALFLQLENEDILKSCIFHCIPNHMNLILKQIETELFAVTNARSPLIMRSTTDRTSETIPVDESWPGALILRVPCNVELLQMGAENSTEVVISSGFPCLKFSKSFSVEHHIPVLWTHFHFLDTAPGILQSVRFPNLSILYDSNWTLKIPHFTPLTPLKTLEKQLEIPNIQVIDQQWYLSLIHI